MLGGGGGWWWWYYFIFVKNQEVDIAKQVEIFMLHNFVAGRSSKFLDPLRRLLNVHINNSTFYC